MTLTVKIVRRGRTDLDLVFQLERCKKSSRHDVEKQGNVALKFLGEPGGRFGRLVIKHWAHFDDKTSHVAQCGGDQSG